MTKALPKNPLHVRLAAGETGLDTDSTALTDHARFVDRARLKGAAIGNVGPVGMALLDRQLGRVFGIGA